MPGSAQWERRGRVSWPRGLRGLLGLGPRGMELQVHADPQVDGRGAMPGVTACLLGLRVGPVSPALPALLPFSCAMPWELPVLQAGVRGSASWDPKPIAVSSSDLSSPSPLGPSLTSWCPGPWKWV